jgi:hypothetical protein
MAPGDQRNIRISTATTAPDVGLILENRRW